MNIIEIFEYEEFKKSIEMKECINCHATTDLTIHHIKPQSKYPHLKFDPENVVCLCNKCHTELHRKMNLGKKIHLSLNNGGKDLNKRGTNK